MKHVWYKAEMDFDGDLEPDWKWCGVVEVEDITNEAVQQAVEMCYTTATTIVHYHEVGIGCSCGEHE